MINDVTLLVEDKADDEALARRALFGTDGSAPVMPAVIPMDLKMHKLNGIETLDRIRADERTAKLPVTMVTTSDEEVDIIRSYQVLNERPSAVALPMES